MIEEKGKVVEVFDNNTVEVVIERSEACNGCSAKSMCQPFGEKEDKFKITAINSINAQKGDTVIVAIPTSLFLKASFIVYLVPIILMLAGAFIGEIFFANDIINFLFASIFFVAGFFLISKYSNKNKENYVPTLIKVYK